MIEFVKIKETCLYVEDLERAKKFYNEVLGLPIINYVADKHLFLRAGSSVLLIFNPEDSRTKQSPPAHYGGGKQHFAFEVEEKNYNKAREEIIAKGVVIIDEVKWKSGKSSFYFNDPDGNVLEILPANGIWE
jgi:catechol 2,3-dioxygenase-like lactoylglutathione lyase family enzyme